MANAFQIGPWQVKPSLGTLSANGRTVRIEPKVMEVLVCLVEHAGDSVSKETLFKTVWPDTFVTDDVLTRSISELRRVFEDDPKDSRFIQTIPKRGYRLVAAVQPVGRPLETQKATPPVAEAAVTATKLVVSGRRWRSAAAIALLIALLIVGYSFRNRLAGKVAAAPIHSIAVLPLQNLSGDPKQDYLADGLTDALITDLAQIPTLKVISRTSIIHYKNSQKNLPEIARELNVDGIVEGTVQRAGDRVRITAQLVRGPTDEHLWARSYDRDIRDALTLEGEAAQAVAEEIQAQLTPQEKARLKRPQSANLPVLEAYLQGVHHLNNYGKGYDTLQELKKAEGFFQQAIDKDPSFAPAYIKLAETYEHQSEMLPPNKIMPLERVVAEKALSLDPNLSDAHLALGRVKFEYDWEWTVAETELRRALELNPSNANAHETLGDYLEAIGRLNEGMDEQIRAQELDPNVDHLSNGFYRTRQYDRGIEWLKKQIEVNPSEGVHYMQLYTFYGEKGMQAEFVETVARALTLYGFAESAELFRRNYAKLGYVKAVRAQAAETEKYYERGVTDVPGIIADLYSRIGDRAKALHWLEIAVQEHDGAITYLNCDPQWDSLRSDPRFKDLVRRVGLPAGPTPSSKN
jgi:TolB-like protein/DNA-binding winged helix-turn-helix (wHTH) protein